MDLFSFIKSNVSILDLIQEYATLKKAGLYWKGRCPFHHEKTASFTVSPHREIFYCFGCHAGGDVISFIAKIENCSQKEAAQHLVERYQLTPPPSVHFDVGGDTSKTFKQHEQYIAIGSYFEQGWVMGAKIAVAEHFFSYTILYANRALFSYDLVGGC